MTYADTKRFLVKWAEEIGFDYQNNGHSENVSEIRIELLIDSLDSMSNRFSQKQYDTIYCSIQKTLKKYGL